jgi:hypothetical protein
MQLLDEASGLAGVERAIEAHALENAADQPAQNAGDDVANDQDQDGSDQIRDPSPDLIRTALSTVAVSAARNM